jgi:transposase
MAYNFLACDRDQAFLLPPDVRDWLPADHLAWFILDVVDQLDLDPFLAAYRADGHGRAAYQPRMLLAVLLYGYCTGVRSSRQIERRCREDIAFRVLAGNRIPDHVTIAGSGSATSKPWPGCWWPPSSCAQRPAWCA